MELFTYLKENKNKILKLWLNSFWERFGKGSAFFKKEVDHFTNPFAYHIEEAFREILQAVLEEFSWDRVDPSLEKIAQIRAVQEVIPSIAGVFLIDLKKILRDNYGDKILTNYGVSALLELEDRINSLFFRFMDFYLKHRERMYEIKIEEWKRNHYLLLKRAGLILEDTEDNTEINKH